MNRELVSRIRGRRIDRHKIAKKTSKVLEINDQIYSTNMMRYGHNRKSIVMIIQLPVRTMKLIRNLPSILVLLVNKVMKLLPLTKTN